jgi:alcohol dehydrogenase class IV
VSAVEGGFGLLRSPREVVLGVGQRRVLPAVVQSLGSRALVVTDPHLAAGAALPELVDSLTRAGVAVRVFDETVPELPLEQVPVAAELAGRHGADVVLGFGGGSCLDLAKVLALLLAHGGEPADYYGEGLVPGPIAPVVAVPTTAGTGSEVTPVAVVTDPGRTIKVGISSPHLIPAVAVCDPELTVSCPRSVTAAAGADALTHGIEAFTAVRRPPTPELSRERVFVGTNALTDLFALEAVRTAFAHLKRACDAPDDLDARSGMMRAALTGGLAFGTAGTAAAHALQYPIGALTHTPHGAGVGALIPYVMAFNAAERVDKLGEIARAIGTGDRESDAAALARSAVRSVADLLASVGIPRTIADLGVAGDRLPDMARDAMHARRLVENNPRPLTEESALVLLRAAHAGDLSVLGEALRLPSDGKESRETSTGNGARSGERDRQIVRGPAGQ